MGNTPSAEETAPLGIAVSQPTKVHREREREKEGEMSFSLDLQLSISLLY